MADAQLVVDKSTYVEPVGGANVGNAPLHGDAAGNLKVALSGPGGAPIGAQHTAITNIGDTTPVTPQLWPEANDVTPPSSVYGLPVDASLLAFDGTNNPRLRAAAAAVLGAFSSFGSLLVHPVIGQPLTHSPAAATLATVNRAGAAGVRHVCKEITASLWSTAALAAVLTLQVVVRDGASGAGAILWSATLSLPGAAPVIGAFDRIALTGLNIIGTAGNQMTVEFSAAGPANSVESINAEIADAS